MRMRLRQLLNWFLETFWIVPAVITLAGIGGAVALVSLDKSDALPQWLRDTGWIYNGGGTGARTLLGAVASSTIGVAGTVFSITIASLSLAAGQMGPRLLRNFTHDRGVQVTLGVFIGTYSYALMVLRAVRTEEEGLFTPHLSITVAMLLAFVCVGMLVYFVDHMAARINVDTVIELVSDDVRTDMRRLTSDEPGLAAPPESMWQGASVIVDTRRGYLQQIDTQQLADWAATHKTAVRLLVRPGHFVFPGAPFALITRPVEGAQAALRAATSLSEARVSSDDLEFSLRQLVEVAVRALSAGINDPNTAISVLDRLGASLCDMARVHLPTGVHRRDGEVALVVPTVDYDGMVDAMFHMIRQSAAANAAVLIRILEVLSAVASCEPDAGRRASLQRHADLVLNDARQGISNPSDLQDLVRVHAGLRAA